MVAQASVAPEVPVAAEMMMVVRSPNLEAIWAAGALARREPMPMRVTVAAEKATEAPKRMVAAATAGVMAPRPMA